jgi:hypothetical protein
VVVAVRWVPHATNPQNSANARKTFKMSPSRACADFVES